MFDRARRALLCSLPAGGGRGQGPAPPGRRDQQLVVDKARIVVETFLNDPDFAKMRVYVQNAYAVLIVPDLLKGGFFIGVEHGTGVLLARDPQSGTWSEPAFYDIWGGSFGLQFGGQTSDAIFTIMNPGAVQKLLSSRFQLGADASVAVGELGAGVGAGTTVQFGEDVYAFARNRAFTAVWRWTAPTHAPRQLEPGLLWPAADGGADRHQAGGPRGAWHPVAARALSRF